MSAGPNPHKSAWRRLQLASVVCDLACGSGEDDAGERGRTCAYSDRKAMTAQPCCQAIGVAVEL